MMFPFFPSIWKMAYRNTSLIIFHRKNNRNRAQSPTTEDQLLRKKDFSFSHMHTLLHTLGLDKFLQAALTKLMGSLAASEIHGNSHGQEGGYCMHIVQNQTAIQDFKLIWGEQPCFYSVTYQEATNTVTMVINSDASMCADGRKKKTYLDSFLFL